MKSSAQKILPKGFLTNARTIYQEVASFSVVPPHKVFEYWHVYTTTNKKLDDPTTARLENLWWHVMGSDRKKLSGKTLAKLFELISTGPTVVPLKGPPNRLEGDPALLVRPNMAQAEEEERSPPQDLQPLKKGKETALKKLSSSALKPPPAHPILKKSRGPSSSGPRPTVGFVSPHQSDDDEDEIPSSGSTAATGSEAPIYARSPDKKLPPTLLKKVYVHPGPSKKRARKQERPIPVSHATSDSGPQEGNSLVRSRSMNLQQLLKDHIAEHPVQQVTSPSKQSVQSLVSQERPMMSEKARGKQPMMPIENLSTINWLPEQETRPLGLHEQTTMPAKALPTTIGFPKQETRPSRLHDEQRMEPKWITIGFYGQEMLRSELDEQSIMRARALSTINGGPKQKTRRSELDEQSTMPNKALSTINGDPKQEAQPSGLHEQPMMPSRALSTINGDPKQEARSSGLHEQPTMSTRALSTINGDPKQETRPSGLHEQLKRPARPSSATNGGFKQETRPSGLRQHPIKLTTINESFEKETRASGPSLTINDFLKKEIRPSGLQGQPLMPIRRLSGISEALKQERASGLHERPPTRRGEMPHPPQSLVDFPNLSRRGSGASRLAFSAGSSESAITGINRSPRMGQSVSHTGYSQPSTYLLPDLGLGILTEATTAPSYINAQAMILDQSGRVSMPLPSAIEPEPIQHARPEEPSPSLLDAVFTPTPPTNAVDVPLARTRSQLTLLLEREKARTGIKPRSKS